VVCLISIIGTGRVGTAIAFLAASTSLDDILLINRTQTKAQGEALDITNAIPKNSSISVIASDFSQLSDTDVIVISVSAATYTTDRYQMFSEQKLIVKSVAQKIKKYANPDAKILLVSNPVDPLTYFFQQEASWPQNQIMGIGSSLDSSRFRFLLAKEFGVPQSEISDAMVLGAHDNTMVPIFSHAKNKGIPILNLLNESQIKKITQDLLDYWKVLRNFKGPSVFGIAKNTYDVISSIIKNNKISIPASVLLNGQYGLSDVCLGVPITVNQKGVNDILEIDLNENEMNLLHNSAATVRKFI
jgi:malate dehydrogenase